MKLHIVPARQGIQWVKLGMQAFFRQPLALMGLYFMFLAAMSVLSLVPVIGSIVALTLLPGATLGLMAATREVGDGKFPMPAILLIAFRSGRPQLRAMLILGGLYFAGLMLLLGCSALIDGGKFAKLFLMGGSLTPELLQEADFQWAVIVTSVLYMPLSLLFWHAPALVHWHAIPPIKSLFFSLVACWRNFAAFTVYSLAWMGVFMVIGMTVAIIATLAGGAALVGTLMYPAVMIMSAMFLTSIYFTFRDNFDIDPGDSP